MVCFGIYYLFTNTEIYMIVAGYSEVPFVNASYPRQHFNYTPTR